VLYSTIKLIIIKAFKKKYIAKIFYLIREEIRQK